MRYSMPVKTYERTPGHHVGADVRTPSPMRKNVLVQIIYNNQDNEIHEFDTARECADFLGLTTEQVQIMGDKHLTLKKEGKRIRVVCDELTEVRMLKKQRTPQQSFPYRSDEKTVWVELEEPIFGYTEISSSGALKKETPMGNSQRKACVDIDGEQVFRFKPFSKGNEYITIKAETLFNQYVRAFDKAFKERRKAKNARKKAKV